MECGGDNWPELVDTVYQMARPLPDKLNATDAVKASRARTADVAAADLARIVAHAFQVPPLRPDGSGFTEGQLIGLMGDFLEWVRGRGGGDPPFCLVAAAYGRPARLTARQEVGLHLNLPHVREQMTNVAAEAVAMVVGRIGRGIE